VPRRAVPDPLDFRALDVDFRAPEDERPELAVDLREVPPLDFRVAAVDRFAPDFARLPPELDFGCGIVVLPLA